jgi:carbonic anhydrase/acetyltransferase-like protein (isoleucine patch superfamily)
MIVRHDNKEPQIAPSARVAPNAVICGDVTIGENSSVGFGCVMTAESGPIRIGTNCVIMDTAVLRGVRRGPLTLGDNVLVGPRASLTGCTLEDDVFLATGATVFNGALIGSRSEVRVNGVVHLKTVLPPDSTIPIGWIAVGDPAEILPPNEHGRIWALQEPLDFPRFVFGVDRPPAGQSMMPEVMPRYARRLRGHNDDSLLADTKARGQR